MSMQWNHDECWQDAPEQDERNEAFGRHRAAIAEAEAEAATQRAEEWAAFEQDMQTAYPWPEIDPFTPRKAA